jgi:DNA processing protein
VKHAPPERHPPSLDRSPLDDDEPPLRLSPFDDDYPRGLYHLDQPPLLTLSGPLGKDQRTIAIVGSRSAPPDALDFTYALAYHLAKANIIVVSGGAVGVDRSVHEGTFAASGTTWCVACTGYGATYPPVNRDLFAKIEASASSRMIWPLPDGTEKDKLTPRFRNSVLVALAECVVVVQAGLASGSRNAVTWARELGRRLVISPGNPWDSAYEGSLTEVVKGGVEILWSVKSFFAKLGLPEPDLDDPRACRPRSDGKRAKRPLSIQERARPRARQTYSEPPLFAVDPSTWSADEKLVFSKLSMAPIHQDFLIERTGLPTSSTLTALLTLSLKDVVVEGPDGFFRRRNAL